ncbi:hypothetical protein OBBRIDRAFT_717559, partial [Obba rivulosa]
SSARVQARAHPALGVYDILCNIFEELASTASISNAYQDMIEIRRTLARAARVCKAFYEPALKILWKELNSLMPLLQLL